MDVALHLQAMQLDHARQAIAQAQARQPPALPTGAPQPVPDVILDLSLAAQQLLSA